MKKCSKCGETKPRGEFHRNTRNSDGLQPRCRSCISEYDARRNAKLPPKDEPDHSVVEVYRACPTCNTVGRLHADYNRNRAGRSGYGWQCRLCSNISSAVYQRSHLQEDRARASHKRAMKLNRTPPWQTSADRERIRELCAVAHAVSVHTGVPHHVDHIVPMQGDLVSGLHVSWNLQILTAEENLRKSNKFDMETQK